MIEQTYQWLASPGAPNGLLLLAVLTSPKQWSKWAKEQVESRLEKSSEGNGSD